MIKNFITLVFLTTLCLSPVYSQQSHDVGIDERMTLYFPIFDQPNCSTYLTDFGTRRKLVQDYANSVGINFFANIPLPNMEGVTSSMYTEPELMKNERGESLSEYIFYSFIFNEDGEYFAFSVQLRFVDNSLARKFQENLLEKTKTRRYTDSYVGVVECNKSEKKKMVVSRVNKNIVTFVVLDYDMMTKMSIDSSRL